MLRAIDDNNNSVLAFNAVKGIRYRCPECNSKVILRKGENVRAHFAHQAHQLSCIYQEETLAHYQAKYVVAQQLEERGYTIEVEKRINHGQRCPDITVNQQLAIEIQLSNISMRLLKDRTHELRALGYKVIWVINEPQSYYQKIKLSQFQSACIDSYERKLFAWSEKQQSLIIYTQLQHIGGQWFMGQSEQCHSERVFSPIMQTVPKLYKLSYRNVERYLQYCRRINSVHEPTLEAMYNLRMSSSEVATYCGYILPQQLYVASHPIAWQIQILYSCHLQRFSEREFIKCIKTRYFLDRERNTHELLKDLVTQYFTLCTALKLKSVQKSY
ncbi:competence protein CoiA family protein [Staphylococcus sp. SQ8-PEA]|uniref:Competence protein CoiA family protein n=2 Tax=Staphylococcus marylandisciuri TaxID=2981529 RepID=A0ABT2QPT5_9STAP|nr:competence protein CoiA family protein [Staphylococcus marylandisciuri]